MTPGLFSLFMGGLSRKASNSDPWQFLHQTGELKRPLYRVGAIRELPLQHYICCVCGAKRHFAPQGKVYACPISMAKLKLDLHDICKRGHLIENELNRIIAEAVEKRIALVEIIPGKGSGQLKKTVLRFLNRPEIKKLYHRIDKDSVNFGRLFVRFKH